MNNAVPGFGRGERAEQAYKTAKSIHEANIEPLSYPATAILSYGQLAAWLQVSEETLKDWPLPRLRLPGRTVRFSAGQVLAYLEGRDAA